MVCNGKIWMRRTVFAVALILFSLLQPALFPGECCCYGKCTQTTAREFLPQPRSALLLDTCKREIALCGNDPSEGNVNSAGLVILFTNDLHSNADYPRLATLIKEETIRAEEAGCAVVLLDAGDIAMGSLYQTLFSTHAIEYLTMSMIGYDAVALGNHDFDFGLESLEKMFECAEKRAGELHVPLSPLVVSNLSLSADRAKYPFLSNLNDTITLYKRPSNSAKGLKIGLFGLMGNHAFSTIVDNDSLILEKRSSAAARAVKSLKEAGAECIICLSHGGSMWAKGKRPDWSEPSNAPLRRKTEDGLLASEVDGIDVVISGHDHDTLHTPVTINGTIVASAGAMGRYLGKIQLAPDGSYSYTLIPVVKTIPQDSAILKWIERCRSDINSHFILSCGLGIDDTIAHIGTGFDLNITPDGNLPLASHIARSYVKKTEKLLAGSAKNPISIVPYGIVRSSLGRGAVTVQDVYNVLSLGISDSGAPGYPLVVAWLYGSELYDICELNATVAWGMEDARLFFEGVKFRYDRSRPPFMRVIQVEANGEPVVKDSLYQVVTGLYTAKLMGMLRSSSFGILSVEPKDSSGRVIENLEDAILPCQEWLAFAEYIKENGLETPVEKCSIEYPTRLMSLLYALFGLSLIGLTVWRLLSRKP